MPSYGCDRDAVNCIANELRCRISMRSPNVRASAMNQVFDQTIDIHAKADVLLQHVASLTLESSTSSQTMDER